MPIRHNGTYLDDASLDILRYAWKHESCSTRDITVADEVELEDNDRVRYRFGQLEEAGLVSVTTAAGSEGGGHPPKRVTLTDEAEVEVKRGLLGDVADTDASIDVEKEQLKKRVDELENRVDSLDNMVWDLIPTLIGLRDTLQENGMKPKQYIREAEKDDYGPR